MKLGICYPYELAPDAALDLVRTCDARGLDSVWIVENPGWPGAFSTAGAVAAVTRKALVSIGIVSAFTRAPAVIAVEAGQLQKISGGRFRLGVGVGPNRVLANFGIDTKHPVEGIAETIEVLRPLLAGQVATHQGPRHTVRDFKVTFGFDAPSIHIGTIGPKMTALAGRVADGVIISTHVPAGMMKDIVTTVGNAAKSAGRDAKAVHITAFVVACFRKNVAEARDALRPRLAIDIARVARNVPTSVEMFVSAGLEETKIRALIAAERPADVRHLIDDSVVDALCFAGNATDFQRRLVEIRDLGVDEVVLFQAPEEEGFMDHLDGLIAATKNAKV